MLAGLRRADGHTGSPPEGTRHEQHGPLLIPASPTVAVRSGGAIGRVRDVIHGPPQQLPTYANPWRKSRWQGDGTRVLTVRPL